MNRLEHLTIVFAEECNEVSQALIKCLRFGFDDEYNGVSNKDRLITEFSQLIAMRQMLEDEGISIMADSEQMEDKVNKVEKYLLYSKEMGTLE
mgnify:CR=1 FL=1